MGWLCEEPGCNYYTEDEGEAFAHCDAHTHSLAPCPRSRRPRQADEP